ncbi:MAG: hypothetical protein ABSA58_09865 [Acetobacteraceae bacterium]|jgi:uncharacterized membrane protein
MPRVSSRVRKGAAILACLIAPLSIHVALATQRGMVWAGALIVLEAVVIAWIALSFAPTAGLRWTGCAAVFVITLAIWRFTGEGIVASSAVPHTIAYLSLLAIFAASLAPGRKAIITVFAEKSRGDLPPIVVRYTRRVTVAWCLFCAGQLLVSLLLLLFAPFRIWSLFVNVLNLPLLVAMFSCEFAWRTWRHGSWPRERLTDGFRLASQIRNP